MPPKNEKEIVIIALNVAVSSNAGIYKDYMNNAKEFITLLIEKKILLHPRDEVGIILMGVEGRKNSLKLEGICDYSPVQVASWDIVEKVNRIKQCKGSYTNWLNGLKAASNLAYEAYGDTNNVRVILISNYTADSSLDLHQFNVVAEKFAEKEIKLLCIGAKSLRALPEEDLNNSEQKILEICDKTANWYTTFDYAISKAKFFTPPQKKLMAWKCDLMLHDIRIPTMTYLRVRKDNPVKSWQTVSVADADGRPRDPVPIMRKKQLVDRHKTLHTQEDTVRGFMYGRNFVPVSDEDREGMKLPGEPRSFQLYGVTDANLVNFEYRTANTTHIILPEEGAEDRFFYFLMAMHKLNLVGLARKVYNSNNNPTVNILAPCVGHPELPWCFLMYQLIFSEERGVIKPKDLTPVYSKLPQAKKEAVGDLIDSMFVETDEEESSATKFVPAPDRQHVYNMLAYRALHPDEPLPPPENYLMALLKPPESLDLNQVTSCVEKVKELFDLKKEEPAPAREKDTVTNMEVDNPAATILSTEKGVAESDSGIENGSYLSKDSGSARVVTDIDDLFSM